jgi:prepilin-type N-terminal cleavage/methylation domain-containing protein
MIARHEPAARRRANRTPRGSRRGFSLLELLMVMIIVGLIMGAGLGLVTSIDFSSTQTAGAVKGVLRAAQSAARATGAPTQVELDAEGRTLRVRSFRPLTCFHFESPADEGTRGALPSIQDVANVADGYLGAGLDFSRSALDGAVEIDLHRDSAMDFLEGFSVELMLCLSADDAGRIYQFGDVLGLDATAGGGLKAWLSTARDGAGADGDVVERVKRGGREDIDLPPGSLTPGLWHRVRFSYDRVLLCLEIDGFAAGALPVTAPVPRLTGPLVLGGRPSPFRGRMDELVVGLVELSEPLELPKGALWPADAPTAIRFAGDGSLDAQAHPEDLRLTFAFDDGLEETLTVGRFGNVR